MESKGKGPMLKMLLSTTQNPAQTQHLAWPELSWGLLVSRLKSLPSNSWFSTAGRARQEKPHYYCSVIGEEIRSCWHFTASSSSKQIPFLRQNSGLPHSNYLINRHCVIVFSSSGQKIRSFGGGRVITHIGTNFLPHAWAMALSV